MTWTGHIIAFLTLAAPVAGQAGTPPVPLAPERWVGWDDLLCSSRDCYKDGAVRFAVTVDPDGRVAKCVILESSGTRRHDEQTCRMVTRRGRFQPALNDAGQPIEGRWESTVRWIVPDAPPATESLTN